MWLRDFLCKDLPHCRTMIYGYNAKLSTHGVDMILDYGRQLIEELKKVRNTDEQRKRPLFFVAHSFGGIILAHCLVKAVQAGEDDHPTVASLHRATYGMLLFGIPHKGLIIDDIQKMLAGESNHPRQGLLQEIKSKSDLLANQLVDFKNLIRDRKVVSFYETGQTRQLEFDSESRRWRRTGDFVTAVDTDSALLQLPDSMEDKIPLDADHSMIVKFDSRNSHGYTSARNKLRQFEQDAPKVVAARFCT
jgi:alpha-beta hydrolase superfamily lysophospholipase